MSELSFQQIVVILEIAGLFVLMVLDTIGKSEPREKCRGCRKNEKFRMKERHAEKHHKRSQRRE